MAALPNPQGVPSVSSMPDPKTTELQALAARLRSVAGARNVGPSDIEKMTHGAVPASTWHSWTGENPRSPQAIGLAAFARALDVSVDWLLFGDANYMVDVELLDTLEALCELRTTNKKLARAELAKRLQPDPQPLPVIVDQVRSQRHVERDERKRIEKLVSDLLKDLAPEMLDAWTDFVTTWQSHRLRAIGTLKAAGRTASSRET